MPIVWGSVSFGLDYLSAFVAGFIILIIFCYERFGQPVEDGSFVSKLLPVHLAAKQDYLKAFLIYLFFMLIIYSLLSLVGPHLFHAINISQTGDINSGFVGFNPTSNKEGNTGVSRIVDVFSAHPEKSASAAIPLVLMLILSGASTQYKHLNMVELIIRKITHRIIGIPQEIESLASKISQAQLNFNNFTTMDEELLKRKYGQATGGKLLNLKDFNSTLENKAQIKNWIRLQFLFDKLENRRDKLNREIDINVINYYEDIWNKIKISVYDLMDESYLKLLNLGVDTADAANRGLFIKINEQINDTLGDIHALIAASISNRCQQTGATSSAMTMLGLLPQDVSKNKTINSIIFSIFLMALVVFIITYFTPILVKWLHLQVEYPFPLNPADAFEWATGALFLNGSAAIAAWQYRNAKERKGSWDALHLRKMHIPALQYLLLTVRTYIIATLFLFVWHLIKEVLTKGSFPAWSLDMIWIPFFGIIGSYNGFWVAYTLDLTTARVSSSYRLLIQPFIQAASMACLGYVSMAILSPDQSLNSFNLYLGAVIGIQGFTIGASVLMITWQSTKEKEAV